MPDNNCTLIHKVLSLKTQQALLFILHMQTRQVNAILTIMVAVHLLVLSIVSFKIVGVMHSAHTTMTAVLILASKKLQHQHALFKIPACLQKW